jgi:subtilase family serine protease
MATGGGYSGAFPRPALQAGLPAPGGRAIPDVAYDADHDTGVPTVRTVSGRTQLVIGGGTSLGAPSWAAIAALADQRAGRRLGFLNAAVYRLAGSGQYAQAFRDVTQGDNTVRVRKSGQVVIVTGYSAGPGWDAVTGWGTPLASGLADLLPRYQQADDGAGI